MPKLFSTFLFLSFAINSYAGIGLGDWTCKTPNGNEINNFTDLSLYLKNGQVLNGLNKWYFYKDNIIGQLQNNIYFAVNERTSKIDTFHTEREWHNFIEGHGLKPSLWTRWYETDWKFFDDDFLFLALVFFYVSIPLLILFIWIGYKAIRVEKLSFRKPFTIMLTVFVVLIFANFLFEQFPQSL